MGLVELFGGKENLLLALTTELHGVIELEDQETSDLPLSAEEEAQPLDPADAAALRVVLTYDAAYAWDEDEIPDCAPHYDVALIFRKGEQAIRVDICLSCRVIRMVQNGKEIATASPAHGWETIRRVLFSYFPGHPALDP